MPEIGVDIGGTFTDVVLVRDDATVVGLKVPTTPGRLTAGVVDGIDRVLVGAGVAPESVTRFVHGTTVATNAVLERRGATTGVVTTDGFRDVLDIGRLKRRAMYDLFHGPETPGFIAPRHARRGVAERIDTDGRVVLSLDEKAAMDTVDELVRSAAVEALAICLINAHRNPAHEQRLAEAIAARHPDLHLSVSSVLNPVEREYERLCVTAFDAYVRPVVREYLTRIVADLEQLGLDCPVHIVLSRGGCSPVQAVAERPVETLLSGLAGGIRGAATSTPPAWPDLITFDMGGTSCDVALIREREPRLTAEGQIGGFPLQIPMVDVQTIGAGGGSVGWLDSAQGLHVGPRSAGASPGPACYGRGGTEPTVTDAALVLGYIGEHGIGRTDLILDKSLADEAVGGLAEGLGLGLQETALGIHRIIGEHMADLVRLVTVRSGHDPRECALVAFGGAGPMHACTVARSLGVETVIVPAAPGLLCAVGALHSATGGQRFASMRIDAADAESYAAVREAVDRQTNELRDQLPQTHEVARAFLGMRYADQSYDIEVPFAANGPEGSLREPIARFEAEHRALYGYTRDNAVVQVASVRIVVETPSKTPTALTLGGAGSPLGSPAGEREAWFEGLDGPVSIPVYDRRQLIEDQRLDGPLVVEQADCTTVLPPGCSLHASGGTMVISVGEAPA